MRVASLAVLFAVTVSLAALPSRPNIIFVMLDDMGQEWVSGYGAGKIKTPNIDNLMETGLRFNGVYSCPKCTPTRVTVLTGQYPYNHGWIKHWDVPRWSPMEDTPKNAYFDWEYNLTWARVLKSHGYKTASTGKWQLNDFRYHPMAMEKHGFDEWAMWTGAEGARGAHSSMSTKRYWNPYINTRGPGDTTSTSKTYKGEFGPDKYFEFVAGFLTRHKDKPMAIYYPMALPHLPLTSTPLSNKASHIAMVSYIDHLMGKLADTLDGLGIRDRTIIIFTTDNGTSGGITGTIYGKSLKGGKEKFTENGIWAPFIVNCPGVVPAGRTDALADFTDLFPTFVELAGAKMPDTSVWKVDGHSFAKVLTGEATKSERSWQLAMGNKVAYYEPGVGIRGDKNSEFHQRVMRNKDFKVYVNNNKITKIFRVDSVPEGGDGNNLLSSTDPEVVAALEIFNSALPFPEKDQRPKYSNSKYSGLPDPVVYDPDTSDIGTAVNSPIFRNEYREEIHARYRGGEFRFVFQKGLAGTASVTIYDMAGRKIAQPLSGPIAGGREIVWSPKAAAVGIYVVRYTLGKQVWSQKISVPSR